MIFGIGFPRTGTTSLTKACEILGCKGSHGLSLLKRDLYRGNFRLPLEWDVLVGGISHYYIALDKKYPGSKYILTIRNEDDWLDSINRVWKITQSPSEYNIILPGMWPNFGILSYDLDVLRAIWRSHIAGVKGYFSQRQSDLLVFDMDNPEWKPLCKFLDIKIPNESFPYMNKWKSENGDDS